MCVSNVLIYAYSARLPPAATNAIHRQCCIIVSAYPHVHQAHLSIFCSITDIVAVVRIVQHAPVSTAALPATMAIYWSNILTQPLHANYNAHPDTLNPLTLTPTPISAYPITASIAHHASMAIVSNASPITICLITYVLMRVPMATTIKILHGNVSHACKIVSYVPMPHFVHSALLALISQSHWTIDVLIRLYYCMGPLPTYPGSHPTSLPSHPWSI